MYRQYRIGDLPDIEIPHSAVILPLQALVGKDSNLSRQVFVALFSGVAKAIEECSPERNLDDFLTRTGQTLNLALSSTNSLSTPLVASVLELAINHASSIELDIKQVANVCNAAGLSGIGTLLLEETLIRQSAPPPKAKHKRLSIRDDTSEDYERQIWLKLTELYKCAGDYDSIKGIFVHKLNAPDVICKALEAESSGCWKEARDYYYEALDGEAAENASDTEKDAWEEAFYLALAHLSLWDKLEENIVTGRLENDLESVWSDSWMQEQLVPWLLKTKVHCILDTGSDKDDFLPFISTCLKNPERKEFLKVRCSEHIAAFYAIQKKFDSSRIYADNAVAVFLEEWNLLSPLDINMCVARIQNLQKLMDLKAFIKIAGISETSLRRNKTEKLLNEWSRNVPTPIDSLLVWDTSLAYRRIFLSQLENEMAEPSLRASYSADMAFLESALSQKNVSVAMKMLKQTKKQWSEGTSKYQDQWRLSLAKTKMLRATSSSGSQKIKNLVDIWSHVDDNKDSPLVINWYHLVSDVAQEISQELNQNPENLAQLDPSTLQDLYGLSRAKPRSSVDHLSNCLNERALESLQEAVGSTRSETEKAAAHLCIVKFCRKQLEESDGQCTEEPEDQKGNLYASHTVRSLLTAMSFGSSEARQLFPCVLTIVEKYPSVAEEFRLYSPSVPTWMFLGWVSQLLAILDTPVAPALENVVIRLAKTYRTALLFPFRLSSEKYKFSESSQSRDIVKKLNSLLEFDAITECFVKSVSFVTLPFLHLKSDLEELSQLVCQPSVNQEEVIMQKYESLMELFRNENADVPLWGRAYKSVQKKYKSLLEARLGKKGEKLKSGKKEAVNSGIKTVIEQVKEDMKASKSFPSLLTDYSCWLSEFQGGNMDGEIEIPGQYEGNCKPVPEHHIKIAGFGPTVKVMSSLRRPVLLTIRGHDAKDRRFLIKHGEDLRQDQRIEQLLKLANNAFQCDSACRNRSLAIVTYGVTPVTSRLGMIEWVDHTTTFKDFLFSTKTTKEKDEILAGPVNHFEHWLNGTKGNSKGNMYENMYKNRTRPDTMKSYKQRLTLVPWDLLRCAFWQMSSCPEGFIVLRQNFTSSYSVLCVTHWILGIGDRHLSNLLVSEQTGMAIGIDFGHSFGTATQFLPVPELMPFRLTPQFTGLSNPLGTAGRYEECMVHGLRALRNHDSILLATMEVFIKEPSLDWHDFAKKQAATNQNADATSEWYPQQKIKQAHRKLQGDNPVTLMEEDLRSGHQSRQSFQSLLGILRGDVEDNIRARLPSSGLTAHQQVQCLIDQATDPNILGRTWRGWEAWI